MYNKPFSFLLNLPVLFFSLFLLLSCNETYTPRPTGYFRIALPEKKYHIYSDEKCPYIFEIPQYATVVPYQEAAREPCWKYIRYPAFNCEIFLSYKTVNNDLEKYIEDTRVLAYKHTVKADAIDETVMSVPTKLHGIIYDIGGSAASPVQFYVTDSVKHFLRGAMYFNVPPQPDSLAPVIQFLREDVVRMMSTLSWK